MTHWKQNILLYKYANKQPDISECNNSFMVEFMAEMSYFDFLSNQWGGQIKLIIGEEGHRPHSAFTRVWGVPDKNNDQFFK